MQMPAEMLAAIKAQFPDGARGWHGMSVLTDSHLQPRVVDAVGGGTTLIEVLKRTATITSRSDVMRKTIIIMVEAEGPGDTWDSAKFIIEGTSYDVDDPGVLNWCKNAIAAIQSGAAALAMENYFGPIPE